MIETITNWIKANKAATVLTCALTTGTGVTMSMKGCNTASWVKVSVPGPIATKLGTPPQVTLAEAPLVLQDWQAYSERYARQFATNIGEARAWADLFSMAIDLGYASADTAVMSAFPAGGAAMGLVSFALGLVLNRPGTAQLISKEKERSYNAGLDKSVVNA